MNRSRHWLILAALAGLLIMVRLPGLAEPLENDSGANAFLARQMLQGQTLYDAFHPTHHLPGIYYTFELAFRLFGDHASAPKIFLFPWALACAWLLYLLGRLYAEEAAGILAAVFFILVSSQHGLAGLTVEMEHFANLPLTAGFCLLIVLVRKEAPAWQFSGPGLLGALCFLYKAIFVAPLAVAGFLVPLMAWRDRSKPAPWKTMLSRWGWMAAGFILPLGLVAAYFASLGLWQRFLFLFELGAGYLNDPQLMNGSMLPPPFGFPLVVLSVNNAALLVFGLMGACRLIGRALPVRHTRHLLELALVFWLIFSLALAGLRGGGFPYYVLTVVPPLALVAAAEISVTCQRWKASAPGLAAAWRAAAAALVILLSLGSNYSLYRDYALYRLNRLTYSTFLRNAGEEEFASQQVAGYIRSHTSPDDLIYLWGNRVELYYYADRRPPVDILWPSYLAATGSPERIFGAQTKYIILDTSTKLGRPRWLLDGLAAGYRLETAIEGREIYRRRP